MASQSGLPPFARASQAGSCSAWSLTFDVSEGWEPLCAFLGCPVPQISFPRLNSSRQFVNEEWAEEA